MYDDAGVPGMYVEEDEFDDMYPLEEAEDEEEGGEVNTHVVFSRICYGVSSCIHWVVLVTSLQVPRSPAIKGTSATSTSAHRQSDHIDRHSHRRRRSRADVIESPAQSLTAESLNSHDSVHGGGSQSDPSTQLHVDESRGIYGGYYVYTPQKLTAEDADEGSLSNRAASDVSDQEHGDWSRSEGSSANSDEVEEAIGVMGRHRGGSDSSYGESPAQCH